MGVLWQQGIMYGYKLLFICDAYMLKAGQALSVILN